MRENNVGEHVIFNDSNNLNKTSSNPPCKYTTVGRQVVSLSREDVRSSRWFYYFGFNTFFHFFYSISSDRGLHRYPAMQPSSVRRSCCSASNQLSSGASFIMTTRPESNAFPSRTQQMSGWRAKVN